jgi:gas vesicle protein
MAGGRKVETETLHEELKMEDANETTGGPARKDPLRELQARIEAAIDEARPKIRKALAELDERVDEAMQDIRPKAQAAVRDVQPKIDEFVADVQPRLDTLLRRMQEKIDELRRELNSRAARHKPNGASLGELAPPSESYDDGGPEL